MSKITLAQSSEAKSAISNLFNTSPPVLVEVRFPDSATSPDWYLFEEEDEFEQLLDRLAHGVELRLSSVWDLKNVKSEVCVRK